jgi:hypothetical protein
MAALGHGNEQLLPHFQQEILQHPAYSPDLAPTDYHPFPVLNKELGDYSFKVTTLKQ